MGFKAQHLFCPFAPIICEDALTPQVFHIVKGLNSHVLCAGVFNFAFFTHRQKQRWNCRNHGKADCPPERDIEGMGNLMKVGAGVAHHLILKYGRKNSRPEGSADGVRKILVAVLA